MNEPDLPVRIEELLEHSDWVQRLAYRLVGDHAAAQDIVQRTWKAGLRRPPRHRSKIKAWLRRVVRNFAFEVRRAETARTARERAVARAEAESLTPQDLVHRAEATELLAAAVQELAEPYRTAILRRYYQGLPAAEIAAAEGVPVETVRTHLKRGVVMLREALQERHGREWPLALVPLLRGPAPGTMGPTVAPRPRSGATAGPAVLAGAGILAVAAIVVVAAMWTSGGGRPPGAPPLGNLPAPAAPVSRDARRSRPESDPPSAATAQAAGAERKGDATPPALPAPSARVQLELRWNADVPPGPVGVVASPRGVGGKDAREWARTFELAGASGTIELPLDGPDHRRIRSWDLRVERPDLVPSTAIAAIVAGADGAPAPVACSLDVRLAGTYSGIVQLTAPASQCAPFAAVLGDGPEPAPPLDTAAVQPDGTFRLRLLPDHPSRIVIAVLGCRPVLLEANVPRGTFRSGDPVLLETGGHIAGTLAGPDGRSLAAATVTVLGTSDGWPSPVGLHDVTADARDADWTSLRVATDADGRFRVEGLRHGRYRVSAAVPGLTADRLAALTLDVTPDADDLHLSVSGGAIVVTVMRDGSPLAGATLWVEGVMGASTAKSGSDGRARILGQPGAAYTVQYTAPDKSKHKLQATAPPAGCERFEPFEVGTVAAPARVSLTLRGDPGVRRAGVALFRDGEAGVPEVVRDVECASGEPGVSRFELTLCPGRARLVVRPGGGWDDPGLFLEQTREIEPGAGAETSVEMPLVAAGRLELGARGPDGTFLEANCTLRGPDGSVVPVRCPRDLGVGIAERVDLLSPQGPAVVSPSLPPGVYVLRCSAPGFAPAERTCAVRAGAVVRCVVDLARE